MHYSLSRQLQQGLVRAATFALGVPMRKQCLPCQMIVRNVLIVLATCTGVVLLLVESHATMTSDSPRSEALRKLFVYQVVSQVEQNSH